jgi:uncharacterized membrane protein
MTGLLWVALAAVAFVATHLALSHPLRAPIVGRLGEPGFAGVYSLVAAATLGWLIAAYLAAPAQATLWPVGDGVWAVVTLVMLVAAILLMGSLVRNPALPAGARPGALPETARGVYAVTRHPMMWAVALWGACHVAVFPTPANIILAGAVMILALAGSALQDGKKARLLPDYWPAWQAKTSYVPFAAIASGRARLGGFGLHAILGGLVLWLAATWAHMPLAHQAAGVWRWLR